MAEGTADTQQQQYPTLDPYAAKDKVVSGKVGAIHGIPPLLLSAEWCRVVAGAGQLTVHNSFTTRGFKSLPSFPFLLLQLTFHR